MATKSRDKIIYSADFIRDKGDTHLVNGLMMVAIWNILYEYD